jgi:hypothetical protein
MALSMYPAATFFDVSLFGDRSDPGSGTAFVVLAAFVLSFLAIRTSARLTRSVSWWPGGVETEDGVHLHHLVWGICLMMAAGFVGFAVPMGPVAWNAAAVLFGVGAGFTMDEFALWVHLSDVYWSEEGRSSFDAVVVATAVAGLVVAGTTPFGLDDPASIGVTGAGVVVVLGLASACFAKGRILLGAVGLFVPVFALFGAVRLGHPASPWGRRRYSGEKLARAQARFGDDALAVRLGRRLSDLLAGAPGG